MIRRLLVANRGEIARRVFATCRRLGIETAAVFADADADLPFVGEADLAVRLPGSRPLDTYLRGDLIVAAASRVGADAVHPGYGFLSENAEFARAVVDAGLSWVGPTPATIEQMGSKIAAKRIMVAAGIPVLEAPGSPGHEDLPLIIKASAGGGGRGMRIVRTLDSLPGEIEAARGEAASTFGDETVFVEPYVEAARHVEVQIWGEPPDGEVWVLGARDCSIQRRHQKIVEEAPPHRLGEETLDRLYAAARSAGRAIGYVGVGTVEFLLDPRTDRFWFLEMNTRLQVEHPVTEAVFGVDLVELQIAAAEGTKVEPPQEARGHAVEARLYAEEPAADFQPQSGWLTRFEIPDVASEFTATSRAGIRVDAGVRAGNEVSTHFDPMLAKVVSWAPSREQAIRQLAGCLARARIDGVATNRELLVRILRDDEFLSGNATTDFLARRDLASAGGGREDLWLSAHAATAVLTEGGRDARIVQPGIPPGWRNVVSQPQNSTFEGVGSDRVEVGWFGDRDGLRFRDETVILLSVSLFGAGAGGVAVLEVGGVVRRFEITLSGHLIDVDSALGHLRLSTVARFEDQRHPIASGSLVAPMPGSVVRVAVARGDWVVAGQPIVVLESMKMQHSVFASDDGLVTELPVAVGDQVPAGAVLAVVRPGSSLVPREPRSTPMNPDEPDEPDEQGEHS